MRPWRKKFLIAGILLLVAAFASIKLMIATRFPLDYIPRPLGYQLYGFIPITLDLLATLCFVIYVVSRPDTENLFPRTAAVVFVGGALALIWYAICFPNY